MEAGKDNIEFAKKFMRRAEADLRAAAALLREGNYADSAYHSQQTAEKSGKALLILEGRFVRDHIISPLLGKLQAEDMADIAVKVRMLEKHWLKSRYPELQETGIWDPLEEYTKDMAKDAMEKAGAVLAAIGRIMKERHGVVP